MIVVSAFGFTQWFYGVQRIEADAGEDVDRIVIAEEVTVPVELHGGPGNDQLTYEGSGQAVLYGDGGNDLLESGTGDNNYLYGGDDHDVLQAGAISQAEGAPKFTNHLYGGDGEDQLFAGQGFDNNLLFGDDGDDSLFASDYGDVLEWWHRRRLHRHRWQRRQRWRLGRLRGRRRPGHLGSR